MRAEDLFLTFFLNQWARRDVALDNLVVLLSGDALIKDAVLVALLWWSWERPGGPQPGPSMVRTVIGVLVALAVARIMQDLLPARPRPLYDPGVLAGGFVVPFGVPKDILHDWSSFPSDNAVLAFALATPLFLTSRALGLFAYFWATVIICLPRLYLGYHFASDLVGGAVIGAAIMLVAARMPVPVRIRRMVEHFMLVHRGLVYAALFLLTYQVATTFDDVRRTVRTVAEFALEKT